MVDLATMFETEALVRHALAVVEGGGIIYDVEAADVPLDRIPFLDERFQDDLSVYLAARDVPRSTAGLLEDARRRGIHTFAVPYDELTRRLAQACTVPQAIAKRTLNTMAVSLSCAVLAYDPLYLIKALLTTFQGRQQLIDLNVRVVELTYAFVRGTFADERFATRLEPQETHEPRFLVNGSQAVAMGKLTAGLAFQTYYPISPATDESTYLEAHETFPTHTGEEGAVVVVQTEDELAALNMAAGAALTGARSATATSGPGFSLMAEGLGWAGINEVPLVVTLYQRGGPSTGMPTRTEQGDLLFAIRAGHGETPRMVIASGDLSEAFYDAVQAFNYAERFQLVVVHVLDKALASTTQTISPFTMDNIRIERGEVYTPPPDTDPLDGYKRFAVTASGVSPRALLGQVGGTHWLTGGEHTEWGHVTEDAGVRECMMEKRAQKLAWTAQQIPVEDKFRLYGDQEATFTIASWGSNKGAILEALQLLAADGIAARLLQVRLLWPFPSEYLTPLLIGASPLVVVEANYSGQFAQLLREQTGRASDYLVLKYNGRPMSGQELYRAFKNLHTGTSARRIVLRNSYE
jgi:2-oxoglutarate ferredoxin oxidoreductase subunit alpha